MGFKATLATVAIAATLNIASVKAAWSEPALDVPGEGISGSLFRAEENSTGEALFRLSPEELENLGLVRRPEAPAPALEASSSALEPIMIQVTTTRTERVAVVDHRRRSMASRGAAAPPRPVTYKNVTRKYRQTIDLAPIIHAKASKYSLDPQLVRAVIEVESAFQPYAVSHAGAGGLMQLMPGTAYHLGCRDRFDPEQNIEAGARYLRQMYDRFGSWDLAIAAYNAGPGNVEKHGGIPPFAETQRYVVKVKKAWKR